MIGSSLTSPKPAGGFGASAPNNQSSQGSLFGAAKPFGTTATSGGGLFGNNTATAGASTTGFGGFGANNTAVNPSSPFGGGTTGGGLFGSSANKPAFGTGGSQGGLFGAGGFGTTQATSAFGGSGTALSSVNPQTDGTGSTPFQAFTERESGSAQTNHFQSISFMQPYQKFSFEVSDSIMHLQYARI